MPLRIGLCGLGSAMLRAHLPALEETNAAGRSRVVAVCDPDPGRREEVGRRCGAVPFADVAAMLDGAEFDLLVVASPPSHHLGALSAAAEMGVDVLCEKPLGLSPAGAAALDDIRRRHPTRLLATVHQYRHAAAWSVVSRAVRAALRSGVPFEVTAVVERPGTDPLSAGGWRAQSAREGGIVGDHAVHYLALCHDLTPLSRVETCVRRGSAGSESAEVRLRLGLGSARITVTYAGDARRNRVAADIGRGRLVLDWVDATLTVRRGSRTRRLTVESLSDRGVVNRLYAPLYAELFDGIRDDGWRERRTGETLGVARLLGSAFAAASTQQSRDGDARLAAAT